MDLLFCDTERSRRAILVLQMKETSIHVTAKGTAYHWQIKQTNKQFLHRIRESVIIRTYTTRTKIACIKMLGIEQQKIR